ncbi:nuclear transport factor 2 family protein [Nocardiopsis sp. ARC36]
MPEQVGTEIERVLVDGNDAVVLGEIRQTARPTGRAYRARFAMHLTFEDGLVTRHHVCEDSLAVAEAFDSDDR